MHRAPARQHGDDGIGGGGKIGSQATFATIAAPGSPFAMFQSPGSSFAPFRRAGAVLIDTSAMQPIAAGVVGGSGRFEVKVTIPNDPSLAGLTVFGQAAIGLGGGDLLLSNPDCKTLSL